MDTARKSVIGAPGYLSEEQMMKAELEADEKAGFKPSRKVVQTKVDLCVAAGIPKARAERIMGLKK